MITALSSCCSWNFDLSDFNFTAEDLNHFAAYEPGDTTWFINGTGATGAIIITGTEEENEQGSRCFSTVPPHHAMIMRVQHLPEDLWYGTTYFEGETKEIIYQPILSITKFPVKKLTTYDISFQGFVFTDTTFGKPGTVQLPDGTTIYNCYAFKHSYPERIQQPTDITMLYWTDQYGLTAYTNKTGDTWILQDLRQVSIL